MGGVIAVFAGWQFSDGIDERSVRTLQRVRTLLLVAFLLDRALLFLLGALVAHSLLRTREAEWSWLQRWSGHVLGTMYLLPAIFFVPLLLLYALLGIGSADATSPPQQLAVDALPAPPRPASDDTKQFAEAEAVLKRFETLRFKVDPKADVAAWSTSFGEFVRRHSELMIDLQSRYARLGASAAPEYAVPALVRVGEVMERFASDLATAPVPHDALPPETVAQMRKALSQMGDALRKAARGHYEAAIRKAESTGITGEWVEFAKKRWAALGGSQPLAK